MVRKRASGVINKRIVPVALLGFLLAGGWSCSSDSEDGAPQDPPGCMRASIEAELNQQLSILQTDTDFSFYIENAAGASYSFNRGTSTLNTLYESASTSKWVAAATILWVVDQGVLSLADTPSSHLSGQEWPLAGDDALATATLRDLLSFTSGFNDTAFCNNLPGANFFTCVATIAENNAGSGRTPGAEFYYDNSHMQIAGAMAVRAGGFSSWQGLFNAFKSATALFPTAQFDLPSLQNPRLAGGMTWTGEEYIDFLRAFRDGLFLPQDLTTAATRDQVGDAAIINSPALAGLGQDWRYGFGLWLECDSPVYSCTGVDYISSPGAYGAYPFIQMREGFFGLVARQGELGTFRDGYAVYDAVRDKVEDWAACETP
jgi:CubicO group peptidase (beta-lactamase class C family)